MTTESLQDYIKDVYIKTGGHTDITSIVVVLS